MKKTLSLLLALLFFSLCLAPSLGMLVLGESPSGANEVLSVKPRLLQKDGKLNCDYLPEFADYLGDRFAFRQSFVTLWAKLNAAVFSTSTTDSVLLGRDGWLYYAPTLADYTGSAPLTERELWCAARTLSLLQEYTEDRDGQFLFVLAPNKNSLYPEHMPERSRLPVESNAARLMRALSEANVSYVDYFSLFARQTEPLYFATDSHWNGRGAALGADAILQALGRDGTFFSADFLPSSHKGDLYEMLYPAGNGTEPDHSYAPGFTFSDSSKNTGADSITLRTVCENGEGSLLLYRDSFGRNLYPYLAERFASAEFSRKNDYDPTGMANGGALVIELVERNIRYLNRNLPTLPAPLRNISLEKTPIVGAIPVSRSNCSLEGYTKFSGSFTDHLPDDASIVYIGAGDAVYEAVPGPEGFSACLPLEAGASALTVYCTVAGELIALDAVPADT